MFIFAINVIGFVSAFYTQNTNEVLTTLNKGWSLISVRVADAHKGDVDLKYGYFYDNSQDKYVLVWKNGNWLDQSKDYSTTNSMWMYSSVKKQVTTNLGNIDQNIPLKKGWNFAIILPSMYERKLNAVKGNCEIEKLYAYMLYAGRNQKVDSSGWGYADNVIKLSFIF